MDSLVDDQLRFLGKERAANGAPMRLDVLVRPHVLRQMALERAAADVAVERLQILVKSGQVLLERVRAQERLSAQLARVVALVAVRLHVHLQADRAGVRGRALRAVVLLQDVVGGQVLGQLPEEREREIRKDHFRRVSKSESRNCLPGRHVRNVYHKLHNGTASRPSAVACAAAAAP